jgi:hypothetical protein
MNAFHTLRTLSSLIFWYIYTDVSEESHLQGTRVIALKIEATRFSETSVNIHLSRTLRTILVCDAA